MMTREIPASEFAIVRDTQRNIIVDSGTYDEMVGAAIAYNHHYQSDAYKAEKWIHLDPHSSRS